MTTPLEFAQRCAAAAADLALAFAGQPDEKVDPIARADAGPIYRPNWPMYSPADVDVPRVVDLFVDAILARKREMKRDGSGYSRN